VDRLCSQPITTVSLAANTYCMMDGLSFCSSRPWATGSNLAVCVNRAIDDRAAHAAGCHLLSVVQAATNTDNIIILLFFSLLRLVSPHLCLTP